MGERLARLFWVTAMLVAAHAIAASDYEGKKVLYINSYHLGYAGNDPITDPKDFEEMGIWAASAAL